MLVPLARPSMEDPITYPKPPGQARPYPAPTKTGKIAFTLPFGLHTETYFEVWGDLASPKTPLVCLHGGPGIPPRYLHPLSLLWVDYGIPVVIYDQIGCGRSTHLRDRAGDAVFWTFDLFIAELDNLKRALGITQFDVLGHSWGGMLAAEYAITRPVGLRKLILASTLASSKTWGEVWTKLRATLPVDVRETLDRCEREGKTESEEYEAAVVEVYKRYLCRLDPFPEEAEESLGALGDDNTVYLTMWGENEFLVTGSLADWSIEDRLYKLTVKSVPGGILLTNGYFDEVQDELTQPFFDQVSAKVKWVKFGLSAHMSQLEETEKYIETVGRFLTH